MQMLFTRRWISNFIGILNEKKNFFDWKGGERNAIIFLWKCYRHSWNPINASSKWRRNSATCCSSSSFDIELMKNNDSQPLGIRLVSFWNLSKQLLSAIIVIGRLTFNSRIRTESIIIILQFTLYTQLIESSLERKIIEWNQFPCSCYSFCTPTHTQAHFELSERHSITLKYGTLAALCYIVVSSVCVSSAHFARRRHSTSQYFIYWFNECNFQHTKCQM